MANQSNGSPQKITISDIARESDVSPATVSLVLREKPGVGSETRKRVLEVAEALGYLPPATPLRSAEEVSLKQIGIVMKLNPQDPIDTNHFYSPVITGIESICRQHKSHLLYANLLVDEQNQPLELPRILTDEQIDGLLMIGMELNDRLLAHLVQRQVPVILVDGYAESSRFDSVVTDNVQGAAEATRYLIDQGHHKIGVIGSSPDAYPSIRERRDGYTLAMEAAGLTPLYGDSILRPEPAWNATNRLLDAHPDVSALFACNDEVAISLMHQFKASGRSVPTDLSIIGFDNIVLARHVTPGLTTMRVDKMSMGRLAAQHMFNRLTYPASSHLKTVIQPQLIIRDSVQARLV